MNRTRKLASPNGTPSKRMAATWRPGDCTGILNTLIQRWNRIPSSQSMLWVGGGSSALCYWNDREKSLATMRGDWIVTADQFRRDEDGYFHYCGRADDMLKVGGIWVSPLEIEECLLGHDAVKECAVIGFEEDGLMLPKAFVVPRDVDL